MSIMITAISSMKRVPASDIVYDTYDFNFTGQTMEGMQLQNAVRVKDENSTKVSTIPEIEPFDGVVPGEIYLIASSAKVAVIAPKTTVRADLNYERVRVNDPNSSIIIAEDPHIKQVYKTVSYMDQVSNDTASVNEFVLNYNLANYATLRGTTQVAPVNKPNCRMFQNWFIPMFRKFRPATGQFRQQMNWKPNMSQTSSRYMTFWKSI